jgi:GTP-binding protein
LLLHLVDLAPFDENADPANDARAIVEELRKYDEALFHKPRWMVLNKVDLIEPQDRAQRIQLSCRSITAMVGEPEKNLLLSRALTGEGGRELTFAIMEHLQRHARPEETEDTQIAAIVRKDMIFAH